MILNTQNDFTDFKRNYDVFGTHTETDKYRNESIVRDSEPKATLYTMWHPLNDAAAIAEYGQDISRMYYCIIYNAEGLKHNDVIIIRDEEYEIVSIKQYNTHARIDVKKKKA